MASRISTNDIIGYLEAGARAAALRQRVIANNIAHLNVSGFRRDAVQFEQLLRAQMKSGGPLDPARVAPKLYKPLNTVVNKHGSDVSMEMEIGELIKNSGRYKAYVRMLNKMFQQMELAISGQM